MNDRTDGVWEVLGLGSIQSYFGNGVLTLERLAARLKVDILRQTLQIVFAPVRARDFPLESVCVYRRYPRSTHIGEDDDSGYAQYRHSEHDQEWQAVLRMEQPVGGQSALPDCFPDPSFT
jgi:hypothetical protein